MIERSTSLTTLFAAFVVAVSLGGAKPAEDAIARLASGARSLGDPLLPQLGNGGYDVEHYRIEIDYDPALNRFDTATTEITATALQHLRSFSFDFQDDARRRRAREPG